ncbi:hypothetical protein Tco_0641050 [Tanacetum coccineum]
MGSSIVTPSSISLTIISKDEVVACGGGEAAEMVVAVMNVSHEGEGFIRDSCAFGLRTGRVFVLEVKRIENEAKTVRGTVAVRGGRHVSTRYCSSPRCQYEIGIKSQVTAVMSADSAVTYTSVHSEARSWSIPSEDPYMRLPDIYGDRHHVSPDMYLSHGAGDTCTSVHSEPDTPGTLSRHVSDESCSAPSPIIHYVPSGTPPLVTLRPLPTPSTSRKADIPEADTPPRKRLLLTAPRPGCEVGESSAAAARQPGPTMARRVDCSSIDTVETRVRDIERRMMAALKGQLEEAWRRSMDASDLARGEVMSLRTTVLGQMSEIRELHAADRRRQAVTSEMLKADHRRSAEMRELRTADRTRQQQLIQTLTVMQSLQGQVTTLQGQVTALQGQVTALQGQQGPAGGPAQPELPEEAGSSS